MAEFSLASSLQVYPSKPFLGGDGDSERGSGSIVIVEKKLKCAPCLAEQWELAGFKTCVIAQWRARLTLPLPLLLVVLILEQNVSLKVMWERCRTIRKHTTVPISILLSNVKQRQPPSALSIDENPLFFDAPDRSTIMSRVYDSIPNPQHQIRQIKTLSRSSPFLLEPEQYQVKLKGQTIPLTPSEYKILDFLLRWPGHVFRRNELIRVLYDAHDAVVARVVDVHISNLRKKIEPDPSDPIYIVSVRGLGYQLIIPGVENLPTTEP